MSGIYEVLRSETEQNLGKWRAEPFSVYPLLYAPTTERRRAQRGSERSGESRAKGCLSIKYFIQSIK